MSSTTDSQPNTQEVSENEHEHQQDQRDSSSRLQLRNRLEKAQELAKSFYATVTPYSSVVKYGLDQLHIVATKTEVDVLTIADRVDNHISKAYESVNSRLTTKARNSMEGIKQIKQKTFDIASTVAANVSANVAKVNESVSHLAQDVSDRASNVVTQVKSNVKDSALRAHQSVDELRNALLKAVHSLQTNKHNNDDSNPNANESNSDSSSYTAASAIRSVSKYALQFTPHLSLSLSFSEQRQQRMKSALSIAQSLSVHTKSYVQQHSLPQLSLDLFGFVPSFLQSTTQNRKQTDNATENKNENENHESNENENEKEKENENKEREQHPAEENSGDENDHRSIPLGQLKKEVWELLTAVKDIFVHPHDNNES